MRVIWGNTKLLWAGIAVLLAVLGINAYSRHEALGRVLTDNERVRHADQVLLETEVLQNLLLDAETGQRGYLYTGDRQYLDPYNRASHEIPPQIDKLAALTADNPQHQARVQQLRTLSQAKLAELAQTLSTYDAGRFNDAQAIVLSNAGQNIMDKLRKLIGEMEAEERTAREQRIAQNQAGAAAAFRSFLLQTAIAALALLVFGALLAREMGHSRRAALALAEQKEWLYVTLRSIGDAVIATDMHGRVEFLNPVAAELTGYSSDEARGRPLNQVFAIFHEETRQPAEDLVEKVMRTGAVASTARHTALRRRDGHELPIDDSAAPIRDREGVLIGVVVVFRDITQQRKMDVALRTAEKLATAGRFAATLAHEINNPLEAVMNALFLVGGDPAITPEGRSYLSIADAELRRLADVARRTLAFYRDSSAPTVVNVPEILDDILSLYHKPIERRGIHVVREYPVTAAVQGFEGELRQAFSNLILNSLDALDANGRLTVRVINEAKAVEVHIVDNGVGIPRENLVRIFEPFFTTKNDVGTGLGLWTAKSLVEKHHGKLLVDSTEGETRFTVLLPTSDEAAA